MQSISGVRPLLPVATISHVPIYLAYQTGHWSMRAAALA
jgi:hypothetical protein